MSNEQHNRDSLIAHIQALDTVIRDRNKKIAELTELLAKPVDLPALTEKKIRAAYEKGFKACYRIVQKESAENRNQLLKAIWEVME